MNNHYSLLLKICSHSLTGTLPASWAGSNAFPQLQVLDLESSGLSGTLPHEWAGPTAFKKLYYLELYNVSVTGNDLAVALHVRCCRQAWMLLMTIDCLARQQARTPVLIEGLLHERLPLALDTCSYS